MSLSLREQQGVTRLARALYDFLPGSRNQWADQTLTFPGAAAASGVAGIYPGGSKEPAIAQLLSVTLDRHRQRFCPLMVEIVRRALTYRSGTGGRDPLTREEVVEVNDILAGIGYKIPELWETTFLDSLPRRVPASAPPASTAVKAEADFEQLRDRFFHLRALAPQARGYAFERFLADAFDMFGLRGRRAFKLLGEQIDGSFEMDGEVYLLEARWQDSWSDNRQLQAFRGSVQSKAMWTRGLFVSYGGFSPDGLAAFGRGAATNLIGMCGLDLHSVLENEVPLDVVLRKKVRTAAETGAFYVPFGQLGLL